VTNCYDDNGRIAWASVSLTAANCQQGAQVEPSNSYASLIGYAPHGAMTSLTYGNGLTESTSFNSRLQPTQIQAGSLTLQYGYGTTNNNGNLLTQTILWQGTWTQNYLYDGANRLLQAAENSAAPSTPGCVDGNANWCETYGYDAFGNRRITARTKLTPSAVEAASYSPATNRIADSGWSYDAAGNILTDPLSGSYAYDAENRQKSAVVTGSGTTQYSYDGDGRRVVSNGLNGQTVFVYDAQGDLAAEYTAIPQPLVNTEYFTVDHLGSTRMVTDSQGNCVERHDYLSFGPEILRTGCPGYNAGVRQKFTGKERDGETGLDYFGARYFSAAQGRFTTPDWSEKPEPVPYADLENPQSLNLYAYGRNNPLSYRDVDGHCTVDGEEHGWVWCAAHAIGITQSQKEAKEAQAQAAEQMKQFEESQRQLQAQGKPTILLGMIPIGPPALEEAAAAGATRGGLGPVLKGVAGVQQAAAEIEAEGGQVLGREITIENSAGRARVDLAYRDSAGNLQLGEAKNGPTAGLNPNQQRVYDAMKTEGAKLVGGNAERAGLPSTIPAGSVRVFKY